MEKKVSSGKLLIFDINQSDREKENLQQPHQQIPQSKEKILVNFTTGQQKLLKLKHKEKRTWKKFKKNMQEQWENIKSKA